MELDVLCASGELLVKEEGNSIIVRPGSLTGVYGRPSLIMATTDGSSLRFYGYVLNE